MAALTALALLTMFFAAVGIAAVSFAIIDRVNEWRALGRVTRGHDARCGGPALCAACAVDHERRKKEDAQATAAASRRGLPA